MKTLNLVNLEQSEVKYKISKFPDGQQQVTITEEEYQYHTSDGGRDYWWETRTRKFSPDNITIKSRLNNFQDLELIICTVKSLRNLGIKEIHLYTPYFLGSRSDRQFEDGSNNYLKDVICPIINSLNFDTITVLDPHSDVLEACLNNFKKLSNLKLVEFFLHNTQGKWRDYDNWQNEIILISPDGGASKKIYKLAEQIGYKGDIITCSKDRDVDGKLTKTIVPELDGLKDIILIDDIFDYGNTFMNITKEITKQGCRGSLYLIVTHSIQTEGLIEALKYFDGIYTTNSFKDHNIEKVKQLNVF